LLLALCQVVKDMKYPKKSHDGAEGEAQLAPNIVRQRTIAVIGWIVGCFLLIWLLTFSWAVPLTILLYLKLAGRERWPLTLIITGCAWLFFYALFERTLNVPFPDGYLFELFSGQP
jgi:heme/copper-type cytochrome/quinol oxidase subunit 2